MSTSNPSNQENDLKSIGLILKKKREELSYTLEHVSEITRITLTCLKHIEQGNMSALPGLVFVRGFIRNYAKLLGLESDWMIEALNQTYGTSSDTPNQTKPEPAVIEDKAPAKSNTHYYFIGAGFVIAVLLVVYIFYRQPANQLTLVSEKVETVQAIDPQEVELKPDTSEIVVPENTEVEQEVVQEQEPPPAAPVISPLTLTLVAHEDDWIRLAIDGQEAFELKLKKGEKYDWPAEEAYALTMTTGNTASIHLNGEEIIDRENYSNQLYQTELNKFTLKQINNQ